MSTQSYTLTADELACAHVVAERRNTLNRGQTNLPNGRETLDARARLQQHYVACQGEIAVSRVLNLCWTGCGKGSDGLRDVGNLVQVRTVVEPHRGLLVRPRDVRGETFVLVYLADEGHAIVQGWATGADVVAHGVARDQETDRPYWVLPTTLLHDLDQLPL